MAERPMLSTRAEAELFVTGFQALLGELQHLMIEETEHLSAGRIRDGLAHEHRKGELAAGYLKGIERARTNAVALARFVPDSVAMLKRSHEQFRSVVERNQAVIATARAVSEGLVKSVAEEMSRQARPQGYGTAVSRSRASASPLVYSARM